MRTARRLCKGVTIRESIPVSLDVEEHDPKCTTHAGASRRAHALGICRAHSPAVDLEAQLCRIALDIDLEEIRRSALSLVCAATSLLVPQHRPVTARARCTSASVDVGLPRCEWRPDQTNLLTTVAAVLFRRRFDVLARPSVCVDRGRSHLGSTDFCICSHWRPDHSHDYSDVRPAHRPLPGQAQSPVGVAAVSLGDLLLRGAGGP